MREVYNTHDLPSIDLIKIYYLEKDEIEYIIKNLIMKNLVVENDEVYLDVDLFELTKFMLPVCTNLHIDEGSVDTLKYLVAKRDDGFMPIVEDLQKLVQICITQYEDLSKEV